jgi:hypothetical protein
MSQTLFTEWRLIYIGLYSQMDPRRLANKAGTLGIILIHSQAPPIAV